MTNILDSISGDDALRVLRSLCASDPEIHKRVESEIEKALSEVDRDDVADEVFSELDAIAVEELWDRSGPKSHGYSSPEDMAVEMVEEALKPYEDKVKQYREIGMLEQSKQYCMGVLKGIYQFEHESKSEFKDWAPDIPGECFDGLLKEWRRTCNRKRDLQEMNDFISRECPKWAEWATKNQTN
jgi:hypothetical protein